MSVTIIIPVHNNTILTRACVESLRQQTSAPILIIDDGSNPAAAHRLQDLAGDFPDIRCIRNAVNMGFSKSVNAGILATTSDIILVNNDCFVEAGCVAALEKALEESPGIIGAKLLYTDRTIQHAGVGFYKGLPAHIGVGAAEDDYNERNEPIAVTFALVAISRSTIDTIGMLHEEYFIAWEDVDYCLTARKAGVSVIYEPTAKAIHLEGQTRGNQPHNKNPYWYKQELLGKALFLERWGDYIESLAR